MTRIAITTNPATAGWKSDVATRTDLEANFVDLYAASAASIPTISAGVALNFLRVNTGATAFEYRTASQVRNQINAQLEDAFLTSVAALGTAADKMIYTTAVDTAAETAITAAGRALIDDAAASDQRTTLGLVAGGAGDIWVEKAGDTMTGPLIQAAGTAANPSYAFSDSGAYRSGALKYAVSIGGVKIFEIDGNAGPAVGAYFYIGVSNYPFYQVVGASPTDGGPVFYLYHNKAAGAASDYPGALVFSGNDSAGNQTNYSEFDGKILDATNGSEDGCVECYAMVAGAQTLICTFGPGLAVNNGSLTLATDLAVTEGGTGASDASTARTNLGLAIGTNVQAYDATLTAFAAYNTNGILTQTAADTFTGRTIAGTSPVQVSNGSGVAGNPTISVDASTATASGIVELATDAETLTGTDTVRAVTPANVASAYVQKTAKITLGTPVASTSGSSVAFTGIPAGVKRVTITFQAVSLSSTDDYIIQIGDSGGIEATGYIASSSLLAAGTATITNTTGFPINVSVAGDSLHGSVTLTLANSTTNMWVCQGVLCEDGSATITVAGSKALSAVLDRITIDTTGTNTFDAGEINIVYE